MCEEQVGFELREKHDNFFHFAGKQGGNMHIYTYKLCRWGVGRLYVTFVQNAFYFLEKREGRKGIDLSPL